MPSQQQLTYRQKRELIRSRRRKWRRGRELSKRDIADIDREIKERIKKFMPYRQKAFTKARADYLLTKFFMQSRPSTSTGQDKSAYELMIESYKESVDEKEKRRLRRDNPVVLEMAIAEEGFVPENDDNVSEQSTDAEVEDPEDDYDYYVEDSSACFDQYLDEDGNLVEGANFGLYETDIADARSDSPDPDFSFPPIGDDDRMEI